MPAEMIGRQLEVLQLRWRGVCFLADGLATVVFTVRKGGENKSIVNSNMLYILSKKIHIINC